VIAWIDAQLPPALAPWLGRRFGLQAVAVRDLNLRDADDPAIFDAARKAGAVVLTKDNDRQHLQRQSPAGVRAPMAPRG